MDLRVICEFKEPIYSPDLRSGTINYLVVQTH
jgi:hypothetical protein